jgi:hypothetical protein
MTTLGRDPFVVSLVEVAASFPLFVFALPPGALADVVDRRRLLIGIQAVLTLLVAGFGFLAARAGIAWRPPCVFISRRDGGCADPAGGPLASWSLARLGTAGFEQGLRMPDPLLSGRGGACAENGADSTRDPRGVAKLPPAGRPFGAARASPALTLVPPSQAPCEDRLRS